MIMRSRFLQPLCVNYTYFLIMTERFSLIFLQAVIVLIGVATLAILVWMPLTEGRATNLDLFNIYVDPLILYVYASSAAYFVALYNAFKLLGYIGQNKVFSQASITTLKRIKNCAIALCFLIVLAGIFIRLTHNKEDDPAGFLALCIMATFASTVVAAAATVFKSILEKGMKIGNML